MGRASWFLAVVAAMGCEHGSSPATMDAPPTEDGAKLDAMPGLIDFGSVPLGTFTSAAAVTFANTGSGASGALHLTITPSTELVVRSNTCAGSLAPGAGCLIEIAFAPTVSGMKAWTLVLDDGTTAATIEVLGRGLLIGDLFASPTVHAFGQIAVGATSDVRTFQITNPSDIASGVLTVTPSGTNAQDFTFGGTCMGTTLQRDGTCTVTAQFHPTEVGTRSAFAMVIANPGGSFATPVNGEGIEGAALAMTPASLDFGYVQPAPTMAKTFTVTNNGSAPSAALAIQVTGSNASAFTTGGTCAGVALAPGASCDVDVTFAPSNVGSQTASVDISSTGLPSLHGGVMGSCCAPPQLMLMPSNSHFGMVPAGAISAVSQLTLTNDNSVTTGPITVSLSGPDAAEFHVDATTCGNPLPNGASCTIDVTMRPTSTGHKQATIDIMTSHGGSPSAGLDGDGVDGGFLLVNPTTLDFSDVPVGTPTLTQALQVQNPGGSTTGTPTPSITGADAVDFRVVSTTCTTNLAPTDQCSITTGFTPSGAGARNATLAVTATPGGAPAVALAGNGTP